MTASGIASVVVSAAMVRRAEIETVDIYNQLFRYYPHIVNVFQKQGARTATAIRLLFNLNNSQHALADDDIVCRLMTLWSYSTGNSIPANLVLVDQQFIELLLIGKTLGYIQMNDSN